MRYSLSEEAWATTTRCSSTLTKSDLTLVREAGKVVKSMCHEMHTELRAGDGK